MGQLANLKQALRARRRSKNPAVRSVIDVIATVYRTGLFVVSGQHRSVVLLKLFNRQAVHQTSPETWMDRYPKIFSTCRAYFGGRKELKILSYGCSTGEEVLTLRNYFPSAIIIGAEINRRSLAICRKLKVDERIAFVHSDPAILAQRGPFDAIFCMAVLQRTPHAIIERGITDLKHIYPFEKFDWQVGKLDELLARDGLLIIRHTQYLFRDAAVAWKYDPLDTTAHEVDFDPKFDRNSERLGEGAGAASGWIFVKIRA